MTDQGRTKMKKLLITLLLISPFSFADWGDVYDCHMTTLSKTILEGKRGDQMLWKFRFKLDKTKNAMVFVGSGGFFGGDEYELREGFSHPLVETWYADGEFSMSYFEKGKFLYSNTSTEGLTAISANCDIPKILD